MTTGTYAAPGATHLDRTRLDPPPESASSTTPATPPAGVVAVPDCPQLTLLAGRLCAGAGVRVAVVAHS